MRHIGRYRGRDMEERMIWNTDHIKNFVFIGEAGCGKSEIAVNLALHLLKEKYPVHLFDLDTTKPLFRTRDQASWLEHRGVSVHFEQQLADAPTIGGGVRLALRDEDTFNILDVGGDYMGARSIGGYAPILRGDETGIYYVINPFRPWSTTLERLDGVLGQILQTAHISLDQLHLVGNPNLGADTDVRDVIDGTKMLTDMVSPYREVEFLCVEKRLYELVKGEISLPLFPLERYLPYPWEE